MNSLFTIIPVKPFNQAKSRLAPVLSPQQRAILSRQLLWHTISVARQISQVVVISRSATVRRVAKQSGAWTLIEAIPDLNEAIRQALAWVSARGGKTALILPCDLPHLEPSTLTRMITVPQHSPIISLAPCHRLEGTNALFMQPIGVIDVAFGLDSFAKHQQLAQAAGLSPHIFHHPNLAFDLDTPYDWQIVQHERIFQIGGRLEKVINTPSI